MSVNSEQLRIKVNEEAPDAAVIFLDGELDPHTTPLLGSQVHDLIKVGSTNLILDLSGLRFIDSSGLRVLISAQRELAEVGGRLSLRSPSETTRRLLEITGLIDHIDIVDS